MGIFPFFFECGIDLTSFQRKGSNSNFTVEKPGKLHLHQMMIYIITDVMWIPCAPGYHVEGTSPLWYSFFFLCGILNQKPIILVHS